MVGEAVTDDDDICVGTPQQAVRLFSEWARIRAREGFAPHFSCDPANPEAFWNQIAADIDHSDLLMRMLRQEEVR